jgi:hypothetical protein
MPDFTSTKLSSELLCYGVLGCYSLDFHFGFDYIGEPISTPVVMQDKDLTFSFMMLRMFYGGGLPDHFVLFLHYAWNPVFTSFGTIKILYVARDFSFSVMCFQDDSEVLHLNTHPPLQFYELFCLTGLFTASSMDHLLKNFQSAICILWPKCVESSDTKFLSSTFSSTSSSSSSMNAQKHEFSLFLSQSNKLCSESRIWRPNFQTFVADSIADLAIILVDAMPCQFV